MSIVLANNFLVPNATFIVELALYALMFVLLVVWPAVGAGIRQQWVWLVMIVLLGPLAGVPWLLMGRRAPTRAGAVPRWSGHA